MSLKFCTIRSQPRKFGISFVIADRVTAEINDKKKVVGKHPLRITRVPSGGPIEFHKIVEEAKKLESPLKKRNGIAKKVNHKKAYHRSRMNDWHVEVFYLDHWSDGQPSSPTCLH
ncbi:hypothetical protein O6P43_009961 [Quillaja saponaria]|uniref:Uncharacterized protein n=1 Tax=Quillaja saponaria TaxID=32244 RepID=A0AAD7PZG0_QUISA|nr:hypothetical protein O6P43_009961 [Quillaja saponaria]